MWVKSERGGIKTGLETGKHFGVPILWGWCEKASKSFCVCIFSVLPPRFPPVFFASFRRCLSNSYNFVLFLRYSSPIKNDKLFWFSKVSDNISSSQEAIWSFANTASLWLATFMPSKYKIFSFLWYKILPLFSEDHHNYDPLLSEYLYDQLLVGPTQFLGNPHVGR